MAEKYSVLMSVYYKEKPEYLKLAIESILSQTAQAEQFVIVKDGKLTKDLDAIIDSFERSNPQLFTVVRNEKNQGLGKALDCGLKYCRNDLVARMDSDDISMPTRCEEQLKLFEKNPSLSICSGNIDEFIEDPNVVVSVRAVPEKQNQIKKRMQTRSAFNHPAVMYRKSEVVRCGGYGKLKRKQDHDLFSRMMNNGCQAYNIQHSILKFRSDANNLKRRKSWVNCKSYIVAQWHILGRHECSMFDFFYVLVAQMFFLLAPFSLVKAVSDKLLRTKQS